jgi:hypothetical protein
MTQNDMGNGFSKQTARSEGPQGARLFNEAVSAYREGA